MSRRDMTGTVWMGRHPSILGVDRGIGPLEAQVLRALDEMGGTGSVRAVCDQVGREGHAAYQSVWASMQRLMRKGILERKAGQGAVYYHLCASLEAITAEIIRAILEYLGGNLDRVVCRVLGIDPDRYAAKVARLRRTLQTSGPLQQL